MEFGYSHGLALVHSQPASGLCLAEFTPSPTTPTPSDVPTMAPSPAPSTVPTIAPTTADELNTLMPTFAPTLAPSAVPSAVPTLPPSARPTAAPTDVGADCCSAVQVTGAESVQAAQMGRYIKVYGVVQDNRPIYVNSNGMYAQHLGPMTCMALLCSSMQ